MSVSADDLKDDIPDDFRRSNGAPMVVIDGKNQRFSRPSGWGKQLDDENALVNWKIWTAMNGVAHSSALQAEIVATKDEDKKQKGTLREKAIQAGRGNDASDTGTALHAMSERFEDPDDDFDPPDEYRADLEAYVEERDRLGLVSELTEYRAVNTDYRAAGTCDRLYRLTKDLPMPDGETLPAGTLVIGDLKTGKKLDFSLPGYTVQMALYAQGDLYDVNSDEFLPTPEINQKWGLLVHLPVGRAACEMLWVDLEVGNWGAWLVQQVREWRKKWRKGDQNHTSWLAASPIMPVEEIAESLEAEIITSTSDEWLDMMSPFAQQRIKAIGAHPKARTVLMQKWPAHIPTIKQGIADPTHMTQVLDLLDKIESDFSLPFPGGDPRVQPGVHKDAINSNNNAKAEADE
jgi:hypothetical protein